LTLALCVVGGAASGAAAQECTTNVVEVDTTRADTLVYAFYGRGFGQVFDAVDTLIHSISIWRPAMPDSDGQPRFLYVTAVNQANGIPVTQQVLLSGPSLVVLAGDGVSPVEYRFVFDPPFGLPGPGQYFFDILPDCGGVFGILAATDDPYPGGQAWSSGPDIYCNAPVGVHDRGPKIDLVFRIEFCGDVPPLSVSGQKPSGFTLSQNHPNPFSRTTVIEYTLAREEEVALEVFDLAGHRIATLVRSRQPVGKYSVHFDTGPLGRGGHEGGRLHAGVYFYRFRAGQDVVTRRMLLVN
jgi:hypothetical protein